MNSPKIRFALTSLMAAVGLLMLGRAAFATDYQITDLGTLGGTTSQAFGINNLGEVVGSSTTASGAQQAFLWQSGVMTNLGVLSSGDTFSRAYAINDSGVIVGISTGLDSGGNYVNPSPFVYSNSTMSFVGTLGGNYGYANGINSAGVIVGISANSNGITHAFESSGGSMTDLGSLPSQYDYSIAEGINSSGVITGWSNTGNSAQYDAFLYAGGSLQDIGNLGGSSRGFSINDAGYIAGDSIIDSNGDQRCFLWHDGVFTNLGTTAGAISVAGGAVNDLNQVVGYLLFGNGAPDNGFLYSDGTMVDLNTLLPPDSGWDLTSALDINDHGQIVGAGEIDGQEHAYLLSPVPEPSTLPLGAVAMTSVGFWMLRRAVAPRKPLAKPSLIRG